MAGYDSDPVVEAILDEGLRVYIERGLYPDAALDDAKRAIYLTSCGLFRGRVTVADHETQAANSRCGAESRAVRACAPSRALQLAT